MDWPSQENGYRRPAEEMDRSSSPPSEPAHTRWVAAEQDFQWPCSKYPFAEYIGCHSRACEDFLDGLEVVTCSVVWICRTDLHRLAWHLRRS